MDKAENEGINKFFLHVSQNNEQAINLYKKLGFIVKKSFKNYFHSKINPERNPAYLMTKEIKNNNNNNKFEAQNENKKKINNKENDDEKKDLKEEIKHLDFKECINNNLNENNENKTNLNNSINNIIEEKETFLNKKRKVDSNDISDDENSNKEIKNTVIKDSKSKISQN